LFNFCIVQPDPIGLNLLVFSNSNINVLNIRRRCKQALRTRSCVLRIFLKGYLQPPVLSMTGKILNQWTMNMMIFVSKSNIVNIDAHQCHNWRTLEFIHAAQKSNLVKGWIVCQRGAKRPLWIMQIWFCYVRCLNSDRWFHRGDAKFKEGKVEFNK